jgi:N-acetylneuraminic acid mutarotase
MRNAGLMIFLVATIMAISSSVAMPPARAMAVAGSWSSAAPRPVSAEGLGAASVGTTVYAMAGNSPALSENDAYDTLTNTWTSKAPLPSALDEPAGVISVGGLVYVIGGILNGVGPVVGTVQVYNPSTNAWTTTAAPMPTPRNHAGVVAIQGKIYVIGGYQFPATTTLNVVEVYDTAANSWGTLASMPTAREGLLAAVVGGKIYAIGGLTIGRNGGSATGVVEGYNPGTNTWTSGFAPMPTPRGIINTMGGALCGDTVLAIGGQSGSGVLGVNEAYQPSTNTWVTHPPMPTKRAEAGSAIVGNKIYVTGGFTSAPGVGDTNVNEAYNVTCTGSTTPILRQFQAPVPGNGRGIAIIGSQIYFTLYFNGTGVPDTHIYVTDLFGGLQKSLSTGVTLGALDFDGTQIWAGSYDGTDTIYTLDPTTGAKTAKFSFSFTDVGCYGIKGFIDGLAFAGGTLWFHGDAASVLWHTNLSGTTLGSVGLSTMCNTGVAFDGSHLWLMIYPHGNPDVTTWDSTIQERDTTGNYIWGFRTDGLKYEDIAYDAVSFAPNCAVWAITANDFHISPTITAFQVPCTAPSTPLHDVAIIGIGTMTPSVQQGTTVPIEVWAFDNGSSPETFTVTTNVGVTQVNSTTVTLASGQVAFLPSKYAASVAGSFTLSAVASSVPGETNLSNNQLTQGTLTVNAPPPPPPPPPSVGGIVVPVDKLALLAPFIGLATLIVAVGSVTAVYFRRAKRREEKQ